MGQGRKIRLEMQFRRALDAVRACVNKMPATIVRADRDYGVHFFLITAGI